MQKLNLMVCPHDTAKRPERWFLFAVFLSRNCGDAIHFTPALDFKEFHAKLTQSDLIYANPQDSLRLVQEQGYIPLARPANLFDEIVLVAHPESAAQTLADIRHRSSASVVSMLPTSIALQRLHEMDALPSVVENRDSWMAVVSAVIRQEVEVGFVYRDFYNGLNDTSKHSLKVLGITEEQRVQHLFLASPNLPKQTRETIRAHLLGMTATDKGQSILTSLGMTHLKPVETKMLADFASLRGIIAKLYPPPPCGCGHDHGEAAPMPHAPDKSPPPLLGTAA